MVTVDWEKNWGEDGVRIFDSWRNNQKKLDKCAAERVYFGQLR